MPALLTTMSMGPRSFSICVTAVETAAKSETSNLYTAMPVASLKASAATSLPA